MWVSHISVLIFGQLQIQFNSIWRISLLSMKTSMNFFSNSIFSFSLIFFTSKLWVPQSNGNPKPDQQTCEREYVPVDLSAQSCYFAMGLTQAKIHTLLVISFRTVLAYVACNIRTWQELTTKCTCLQSHHLQITYCLYPLNSGFGFLRWTGIQSPLRGPGHGHG